MEVNLRGQSFGRHVGRPARSARGATLQSRARWASLLGACTLAFALPAALGQNRGDPVVVDLVRDALSVNRDGQVIANRCFPGKEAFPTGYW